LSKDTFTIQMYHRGDARKVFNVEYTDGTMLFEPVPYNPDVQINYPIAAGRTVRANVDCIEDALDIDYLLCVGDERGKSWQYEWDCKHGGTRATVYFSRPSWDKVSISHTTNNVFVDKAIAQYFESFLII